MFCFTCFRLFPISCRRIHSSLLSSPILSSFLPHCPLFSCARLVRSPIRPLSVSIIGISSPSHLLGLSSSSGNDTASTDSIRRCSDRYSWIYLLPSTAHTSPRARCGHFSAATGSAKHAAEGGGVHGEPGGGVVTSAAVLSCGPSSPGRQPYRKRLCLFVLPVRKPVTEADPTRPT